MPHAWTGGQLIERPTIGLFAELGWQVDGPPPTACVAGEPADAGCSRSGNQRRGGAYSPVARGTGKIESVIVAGSHRLHRGRLEPRPFGYESGGGESRNLSAAQAEHQSVGDRHRRFDTGAHLIRPAATFSPVLRTERGAQDSTVAGDGLGASGQQ